jgi:hypothetical protein
MDGYLVLARCPTDDIPLGLFACEADADGFASHLNASDPTSLVSRVQAVARDVLSLAVSEVIAVDVVEFRGGKPIPG